MELKKAGTVAKKVLKWGFAAFAAAYLASYGAMRYDYETVRKHEIAAGKIPNTLLVENFIANVDGSRKCLALYSETHTYNHLERATALELLKKYDRVYFEAGTSESHYASFTGWNYVYMKIILGVLRPMDTHFIGLARGRMYPNLSDTAHSLGKEVYALENSDNALDTMTPKYFLESILDYLEIAITGPLTYRDLQREPDREMIMNAQPSDFIFETVLRHRDPGMARAIANQLRMSRSDPILAGFGFLHRKGIIWNLVMRENIGLEQADSLEDCKTRLTACRSAEDSLDSPE